MRLLKEEEMKQTQNKKEKMVRITEKQYNDLQSNIFAVENLEKDVERAEYYYDKMVEQKNSYKKRFLLLCDVLETFMKKEEK